MAQSTGLGILTMNIQYKYLAQSHSSFCLLQTIHMQKVIPFFTILNGGYAI